MVPQIDSKFVYRLFYKTVIALSNAVEIRDPYTAKHQYDVAAISLAIADELGISIRGQLEIWLGGIVHDIGKLGIPIQILTKPTKLSAGEYMLLQEHPLLGGKIVGTDFPIVIQNIITQHHERLDGSGYPYGLVDKEIAMEAKIIAVADVFEAMSNNRPYRFALGVDKALEELTGNAGKFYDRQVVEALVTIVEAGVDFSTYNEAYLDQILNNFDQVIA